MGNLVLAKQGKKTRKKKEKEKRDWFIVMNSKLEYFCGMAYGGQLIWLDDYKEAKPLDHPNKFTTLKYLCYGEELIMDYI
jgi:hypothetical protein